MNELMIIYTILSYLRKCCLPHINTGKCHIRLTNVHLYKYLKVWICLEKFVVLSLKKSKLDLKVVIRKKVN